jgi:hypothetical protein
MSKKLILTLPDDLYSKLKKASDQMGVHPLEYIRYLIMKDTKEKG